MALINGLGGSQCWTESSEYVEYSFLDKKVHMKIKSIKQHKSSNFISIIIIIIIPLLLNVFLHSVFLKQKEKM